MSLPTFLKNYLASLPAAEAENRFPETVEVIKQALRLEPISGGVLLLKTLEESGFPQFHRLMQELKESEEPEIKKLAKGFSRLYEQISVLHNDTHESNAA